MRWNSCNHVRIQIVSACLSLSVVCSLGELWTHRKIKKSTRTYLKIPQNFKNICAKHTSSAHPFLWIQSGAMPRGCSFHRQHQRKIIIINTHARNTHQTDVVRCVNWVSHFPFATNRMTNPERSNRKTSYDSHVAMNSININRHYDCRRVYNLSLLISAQRLHLNGNVAFAGRHKMKWVKWKKNLYNNDLNWVNYLWCFTLLLCAAAATVVPTTCVCRRSFLLWIIIAFLMANEVVVRPPFHVNK